MGPLPRCALSLLLLTACVKAVPDSATTPAPGGETSAPSPKPAPPSPPELRLPPLAAPVSYHAVLSVDPSRPTFTGTLTLTLEVKQDTDLLWLNATGLTLRQATLTQGDRPQTLQVVPGNEDFLGLRGRFSAGAGTLRLEYSGAVERERSIGLYSQQEPLDQGWYAYTFFEPLDARRVFPCFDEPGFKVPWTLEVRTPRGNLAFANTREVERREEGGWTRFVFAPSPPMPSYLVAFGVGPFEVVEVGPSGQKQVPTRIVIPKGRSAETRYAREVTPKVVAALESFLGLPYPYDKLDVLVVPRFWGTMEHAGLVAMGQPLTLIPPTEETLQRRQRYTNILVHELGHYWFGNLVTLAWWDDTWLNEALTSWLDTHVTDQLEPSWNWALEHQAARRNAALRTDALLSAQPLRTPVRTREEVTGAFEGSITYSKGATVLGMMEGWVGAERFRALLRGYLTRHSWKNTTTAELLEAVSTGAGPQAQRVFESFITQPGAPLITASVRCEQGKPRLSLSQERWVAGGKAPEQEWTIPVCLRSDVGAETCVVLDAPRLETELPWSRCPRWVLGNAGGRGYYRMRLTADEARVLLLEAKLQVAERLVVASDLAALAARGDVPPAGALALVPALASDPHPLMLNGSLQLVRTVRSDLLSEEGRRRFAAFLRQSYGRQQAKLGWTPRPGEAEEDGKARLTLLGLLGGPGEDPAIRKEARRLLTRWLEEPASLPDELVNPVLEVGTEDGDAALFERLLQKAKQTQDRREKARLLATLGGFEDAQLIQRALGLLVSGEVDLREGGGILMNALSGRKTRSQAWSFLEEHFDALAARLRDDELSWLAGMVGTICEPQQLQRAETLFREKGPKYGLVLRALDNASEGARQCIANSADTVPAVEAFLKAR